MEEKPLMSDVDPTPADPNPADPAAEPTPATEPTNDPPAQEDPKTDDTDWKTKYEETLAHSRRHETQKKDNKAKLDAVLEVLGIEKGKDVDPAQLAKDLEAARSGETSLKVENAILRLAGKHSAHADKLTDSRSFMNKVSKLDTSADDFTTQVESAIKDAIKADPTFKIDRAPDASGGEIGGGKPRNTETDPRKLAAMFDRSRY